MLMSNIHIYYIGLASWYNNNIGQRYFVYNCILDSIYFYREDHFESDKLFYRFYTFSYTRK